MEIEDMFICPKCKKKIPFLYAFILTNFTKIKCKNCGQRIAPNRKTMEKIGGAGVAILLPILLIIYYRFGIELSFLALIVAYVIVSVITYKITKFDRVQ